MRDLINLRLFFLLSFFLLSSCTSNKEGSDDNADNSTSTASISVSIGKNSESIVSIGTGPQGDLELKDSTLELDQIDQESIITAQNDRGQVIYLSSISPGDEELALNSKTTVKALLSLIPGFSEAFTRNIGLFNEALWELDSVQTLAEYIDNNEGWSEDSTEFVSLLALATEDAFAAVNGSTPTTPSESSNSKIGKRLNPIGQNENTVSPSFVHVDDTDKTDNSDQIAKRAIDQSGVNIEIESVDNFNFQVGIQNTYLRWVVVMVGDDPEGRSGNLEIDFKNNFLLPSANLLGGKKEVVFVDKTKFTDEQDNDIGIYAYGLGTSLPGGGMATSAYTLAATYTVLIELAMPLVAKASGAEGCINNLLSPSNYAQQGPSLLKKIVQRIAEDSNNEGQDFDLRTYLKNKKYDSVALKFGGIIGDEIIGVASDCVTEAIVKQLTRLIPIVGQVALAIDHLELTVKTGTLVAQIGMSKAEEFWHFKNSFNIVLSLEGDNNVKHLGDAYYSSDQLDTVDPKWKQLYKGDCREIDNVSECRGLSFEYLPDYSIRIMADCKSPLDQENNKSIPCSHAILSLSSSNNGDTTVEIPSNSSGKIVHFHEFEKPGEYEVELHLYDSEGGYELRYFDIQIMQLFPHVVVAHNGREINYEINQVTNSMETDTHIMDCCESIGDSITETFTLNNNGMGMAVVSDVTVKPSLSNIKVNLAKDQFLRPGESISFDVIYTRSESEEDSEDVTLNFFSLGSQLLGGDTMIDPNDNSQIYTDINLNLEIVPPLDCTKYHELVLGEWSVSHTDYPDRAPYELVLSEGGEGKYVLPDQEYTVNWDIYERDGGCMLLETGFWHYAYNSQPRTLLSDPIDFVASHYGNHENFRIIYTKK